MQTQFSTRTAPEQRQNSRERQRNYYNILGMKRRILHLAGIDNRDADTILAICASMPSSNAPADYTPSKISNIAIAGKLCLRTGERESLERSASRRLSRLLDQGQPQAGREFITRIPGQFNPETSRSEMHTYIDNITPAADQAYQSFIEAISSNSDWKRMPGAEKAAFFDQFALDALKELPVSSPVTSEGETAKTRMNLSDYTGQRKRQLLSSVQQTGNKIEYDYGDPAEKIHFYIEVSHALNAMIQSERKVMQRVSKEMNHPPLAQGAAGNPNAAEAKIQASQERIEKEGGEGERWLIQGDKVEFEVLDTLETQTPPPDKMSPPPCDKLSEYTDLQQAIPAEVQNTRKWGWVELYLERGWAVCLNYYVKPDGSCSCQDGVACEKAGKHPMGGVTKGATRDRGELGRKLRDTPALNIGIATGEISGFDVLDFDGQAGLDLLEQWESKGFIPTDCLRAITGSGNGAHVLIEHIPGLKGVVKPIPGLDIKTTGGQIVVAPSVHRSGNQYEWEKWSAPILKPSAEFKEYLLSSFGKENSEKTAKASAPRYVPTGNDSPAATGDQARFRRGFSEGGRNAGLFTVASALRGGGFNQDQIIEELKQRNILCNPPLPESELFKIANSVSRYPQGVK